MSEKRSDLLQAVLDAPESETPRLVLADWLMQQGDPRGDFISSQCALLGRLSRRRRKDLRRHVAELLEEQGAEWAALAAPVAAKRLSYKQRQTQGGTAWRFRRGFIESLIADADALVSDGAPLWDVEPVIRLEIMGATSESMAELAEQPFLSRVRYLAIRGRIGDHGVDALAASPHLAGLVRLNLNSTGMSDKGAISLARAENLSCTMLALTGNDIGDEGVAALAGSAVLSSVERLYLARNPISDVGVMALAASPHVGQLRKLGINTLEELSDDGAEALASSPNLTHLERIEIDQCDEIGRKGLTSLERRFADVKTG